MPSERAIKKLSEINFARVICLYFSIVSLFLFQLLYIKALKVILACHFHIFCAAFDCNYYVFLLLPRPHL